MLAFYIKGSAAEAHRFAEELKVFTVATSLGGYESLIEDVSSGRTSLSVSNIYFSVYRTVG